LNAVVAGGVAGYIRRMKPVLLMVFALFSFVTAPVSAQTPPTRLDPALVSFFTGEWKGEGAFANGRPIAATLSFRLSLDSAWLVSDHADVPPGSYKATSYWGVDAGTGQFVCSIFDNFHGHRSFAMVASAKNGHQSNESNDGPSADRPAVDKVASSGWATGRLVLTTQSNVPGAGTYFEHFIYERQSDTQFRMTYETSRDAITWRMGDSLLFTKTRPS
jgi:hypothetical protein